MPSVRESAQWLKSLGLSPIPLVKGEKRPTDSAWQKASIPEEEYDRIFTDSVNIGIHTGTLSGDFVDVDLDHKLAVKVAPRFLPPTGFRFGRPGKPQSHWGYRVTNPDHKPIKTAKYSVDKRHFAELRGDGAQTMVPPSVHPSGEPVSFTEGCDFTIPLLDRRSLEKQVGYVAVAALLIDDWKDWSDQHHWVSMHLSGGMLQAGEELERVIHLIETVCFFAGDRETQDRIRAIRDTAERVQDPSQPTTGFTSLSEIVGPEKTKKIISWLCLDTRTEGYSLTDDGNANRFVDAFIDDVRYVPEWGVWVCWEGNRWLKDETKEQIRATYLAREIPRLITTEAAKVPDEQTRTRLNAWAIKSQDASRIHNIPRLAKTDPRMHLPASDFDDEPWLLNAANGVINLQTGGMIRHSREHLLTKLVPVEYIPRAACPNWYGFLELAWPGDPELQGFIKRLVGYAITGFTIEQKMVILWGPKGTGKTTFIETMRAIMGDYAANLETRSIMQRNYTGRTSSDMARLQGTRYVSVSEGERDEKLAVAKIKTLTSSGLITAAPLYRAEVEFKPAFTIFFDTNNRPQIPADDGAIWDRILMVPFTNPIRDTEADIKGFSEKVLQAELPGILAWAIEGAQEWAEGGLRIPERLRAERDQYRREADTVQTFVEDACVLDPKRRIGVAALHKAYEEWCRSNQLKPYGLRRFGSALEESGFRKQRRIEGYTWEGIGLAQMGYSGTSASGPSPFAGRPQA
jgi:putative DNA primase/helicase